MPGLAPYRTYEEREALAFLSRRPYENAYAAWLLRTHQIGRHDDTLIWRDPDGTIAGFALVSPRIVPCSDSLEALHAFAEAARTRVREPRLIVGSKHAVETVWSYARDAMPRPHAIRRNQPVYALAPADLRGRAAAADVALASENEIDELAVESAAMTSGEVGYRVVADAAFRKRTARIAAAGRLWRYRVDGRLAFTCHVGAETEHTAQIQGVWTPAGMRGLGHATRALAEICSRLLVNHPTISLSVNDFNERAIALYERVGFTRAGALSTIIFA